MLRGIVPVNGLSAWFMLKLLYWPNKCGIFCQGWGGDGVEAEYDRFFRPFGAEHENKTVASKNDRYGAIRGEW